MKRRYITTALLALGLVAGCVEVKVDSEGHESKHSEREEKEDRESGEKGEKGEEREEKESKHGDSEKGEKENRDSKAALRAQAKISEEDARKIASAKVPDGKIKEGELERENGHLQWSFDIATPGTKDITEVNVDAISGEVISVAKESAEDEKAEKKKEKD